MSNHKGTATDLAELEDFPIEDFENADMSLPDEFSLDIFAAELLDHITAYQKVVLAAKAARQSGDDRLAEQQNKQSLYHRIVAARIQRQYPDAKALADVLAVLRARQAASNRQMMLSAP